MSRKKVIIFLLVLSILSACSTEPQSFVGESDHWKAELNTDEGEKGDKVDFVLKFNGSDGKSVSSVNYNVSGTSFELNSRDGKLNEEGVLRFEWPETNVEEDNQIVCTVEWDGQTEEFLLNK
ncbi:hypothetical protein CFK37_19430 [Virgibacillus phasianinus]|uniref:Lipoprotein n=1 Tax=Virgibacillus phasianinus TaxID=2017483 RepID=A0A220U802_9BACI|nr:hypothetical protein [Virgibacillus phasianinus]ASK64165.1 hypothetical protein CFK37_19430 [Virgibacillus phasianinus]